MPIYRERVKVDYEKKEGTVTLTLAEMETLQKYIHELLPRWDDAKTRPPWKEQELLISVTNKMVFVTQKLAGRMAISETEECL